MRLLMLALVLTPGLATATDDHRYAEVEAVYGAPSSHRLSTCGGGIDRYGKKIAKWKCMNWLYPDHEGKGSTLEISFDGATGRFASAHVIGGDDDYTEVSEDVHLTLHEARDKDEAVPTLEEVGVSGTTSIEELGAAKRVPGKEGRYSFPFSRKNGRAKYEVDIQTTSGGDICRIEVWSPGFATHPDGRAVRAIFGRTVKRLEQDLGPAQLVDQGPDGEEPAQFTRSLAEGDRRLSAGWFASDGDSELPGGLSLVVVVVGANAEMPDRGYVATFFSYGDYNACPKM